MVDLVDDELTVEHLAGEPLSHDACLQLYRDRCPELIAGGRLVQQAANATVQTTNGSDMTATYTLCTVTKDLNRAGRIVRITENQNGRGLILDSYQNAPVVLFDHGYGGINLPIGMSESPDGKLTLKAQKSKLTGTCFFSQLPHAVPVFAAVDAGLLRMASIGFNSKKAMRFSVKQEETQPGIMNWDYQDGIDIVEAELFEWSITAVGADRGALRQCLERGTVGGEKLPRWLAQSFAANAEDRKAWAPGMEFVQQAQVLSAMESLQSTITRQGKQIEALQAAVKPRAAAATPAPAPTPAPVAVAEQVITSDMLVQAFRSAGEPTASTDDIAATLRNVLTQAISDVVSPVVQEQQKLGQQLKLMSGRLD